MGLPRSMLFSNFIGPARQGLLVSRRQLVIAILGSVLFGATPYKHRLLAAEKPLSATADSANVGYREIVAPFFKQHCVRCHGEM